MAWRKSPPELCELFAEVLPTDARVERRSMFGYPCAFVGGNMFAGLHQESLIVRLDGAGRDALAKLGAGPFEPLPGRVMREYVALPTKVLADRKAVRAWLARSFAYVAALPAKGTERKPARRRAAKVTRPKTTGPKKPAAAAARRGPKARRTS